MAGEPRWVPPGVDTRRANAARVYDYLLGGSHNFLADQDVGRALAAVEPDVRKIAQANSSSWTPAWSASRCGARTRLPTFPTTPASSGAWSASGAIPLVSHPAAA